MGDKGTTLTLGLSGLEFALALGLFYIAWKYTDIQEHLFAAVMGGILTIIVLVAQVLFFVFPEDRRPSVFLLVFFGMIVLPGAALMVTQAVTGLRIPLDGPGAPSPLILLPYLLLLAWVFVRLATWAMTFEPVPGVRPIGAPELRQRLLLLNDGAFPFTVKPGKRADELVVDWKYADATWLDLMRVHHVSSLSRFVLRIDEADRTVRVREQQSRFDASAGLGGLSLSFSAQWGAVTFYEFRQETFYGVQIEHGRPVPRLSYTYRFDIQEMREPLQKLATENGWTFKAVPLFVKGLTG